MIPTPNQKQLDTILNYFIRGIVSCVRIMTVWKTIKFFCYFSVVLLLWNERTDKGLRLKIPLWYQWNKSDLFVEQLWFRKSRNSNIRYSNSLPENQLQLNITSIQYPTQQNNWCQSYFNETEIISNLSKTFFNPSWLEIKFK